MLGSGGGSFGAGSGLGSTGAGNASGTAEGEQNNYGSKLTGSGSAGVLVGDPDAKAFSRAWFAHSADNLAFRTRDFGPIDRESIAIHQILSRGTGGVMRRAAFKMFPSHHQKTLVVDYEHPDDAVGFVMGHNMLRNYWDTDAHDYYSELRLDFRP